jgi:hypothetical protein
MPLYVLHNLPNVLVQAANKMGLKKKIPLLVGERRKCDKDVKGI